MNTQSILLVEDDRPIASLLLRVLGRSGYHVRLAANAGEALDAVRREEWLPDVLVCDIELGTESGQRVADGVRALNPAIGVLYISGYPLHELQERGLLAGKALTEGKTSYVQKPFLPGDLVKAIRRVTECAGEEPVCEVGPASYRR